MTTTEQRLEKHRESVGNTRVIVKQHVRGGMAFHSECFSPTKRTANQRRANRLSNLRSKPPKAKAKPTALPLSGPSGRLKPKRQAKPIINWLHPDEAEPPKLEFDISEAALFPTRQSSSPLWSESGLRFSVKPTSTHAKACDDAGCLSTFSSPFPSFFIRFFRPSGSWASWLSIGATFMIDFLHGRCGNPPQKTCQGSGE